MAKYHYDKSALKGLGFGPFLGLVKERDRHIEAADTTPPQSIFNANKVAQSLHPHMQFAKIVKIKDYKNARLYTLVGDADKGTNKLAYFRAGQYVSVVVELDNGKMVCRPYTICSGPKAVLGKESTYNLLVKRTEGGIASNFILDKWELNQSVLMSGPLGHFYYTSLRDAHHVVALAGGSGITPFYSMASAIANETEDFRFTILYGSRTEKDILLKDDLQALVKRAAGKVRVVHVLSDEEKEGFEHGFITSDLIKKYRGEGDYSVFVCGPDAMYDFCKKEIDSLDLPRRRVRFEVPGEVLNTDKIADFPNNNDKMFNVKVHMRNVIKDVEVNGNVNLMRGLEDAGIQVPSDCRSGVCGWCHSRLIQGDVFIPKDKDKRRLADTKFNWIHPCCTYPISDLEIEIFPLGL